MTHSPPDDEDLIFFRNAMNDVKRITQSPILKKTVVKKRVPMPSSNKFLSISSGKVHKIDENLLLSLSDPREQTITAEDKLFFRRPGPQDSVIKQLIRGEISRSAYLDLHGMTLEKARLEVINFLTSCRKAKFRCVQIIHGKGQLSKTGPKLKNHLNYWLPQISWVLAFSSAQGKDGGRGAVYILLAKSSSFI